jgi:hypothetical protein
MVKSTLKYGKQITIASFKQVSAGIEYFIGAYSNYELEKILDNPIYHPGYNPKEFKVVAILPTEKEAATRRTTGVKRANK